MAPAAVSKKSSLDCVLVKQPEAKITSTTTITPIDLVECKVGIQETHKSATKTSTTTTTTTSTGSSHGEWKYKGATESKTFVCEFPTTSANVNRVLEPLPFPKKLKDLIGWTDAFVDRIAIMTAEQHESTTAIITKMEEEVCEWRQKFDHKQTEIHQREETISSQRGEIEQLRRELEKTQTMVKEKETTIKTLEHDKRTKAIEYEKEIQKWTEQYNKGGKALATSEEHIKRDHQRIEAEVKHRMDVESKLREAETRIVTKDTEIRSLKDEVKRLKSDCAKHIARIRKSEMDICLLNDAHKDNARKLGEANETIKKLQKELAEAKTSTSASEKKHHSHVEGCTRLVKSLEAKVSELTIRRDTLEHEGAMYKKEIERLTTDVEMVKTELTTTQTVLTKTRTELETKKRDNKDVIAWRNLYTKEKKGWADEKTRLVEEYGKETEESTRKLKAAELKLHNERTCSENRIKELEDSIDELAGKLELEEETTSKTTVSTSSTTTTTQAATSG